MTYFFKSLFCLILSLTFISQQFFYFYAYSEDGKSNSSCKNYIDCDYKEGSFCVKGSCKKVCSGGKVSSGLDQNGGSLPCEKGYQFSGLNDLSGRKVCCKIGAKDEKSEESPEKKPLNQVTFGKLCKETSDCKDLEFCSFTDSKEARCGAFNCEGSYVSVYNCPLGELTLAKGPEGFFCCPLIYLGKPSSSSGDVSSSSSSGNNGSSSGSTSSSSGGAKKKKQSSSGDPGDYKVQISLITPEVFGAGQNEIKQLEIKQLEIPILGMTGGTSGGTAVSSAPIETHYYKHGDKLDFTVFVKGPSLSKPQDISSYTFTAVANDTLSSSLSDGGKILELYVNDIVASTDLQNLLNYPPPLNISLIRQDSKGEFKAVSNDTFKLKLPDVRYIAGDSGRLVLVNPVGNLKSIPENKCGPVSDKVCGVDNIGISSCINYGCYKYSKGSPFAKECCKGNLLNDLDEIKVSSSGSTSQVTSSGGSVEPKPQCNKDTKEIQCASTSKFYVPHCNMIQTPSCDDQGKPICKKDSAGGELSYEEPKCLVYSESTNLFCKDVSELLYINGFDPAGCVNDYCSSAKNTDIKLSCCKACSLIYEKVKNPSIEYSEAERIKSCVDFDGGYCGDLKNAFACVDGECYKKENGTNDYKVCCSKFDKNASVKNALLSEGSLSEEQGMIYNVISLGNNKLKINMSQNEIIGQNFQLRLPDDPGIDNVILRASFKDKKGKTRDSEIKIALEKIENTKESSSDKKPSVECNSPQISSVKVQNGGKLEVMVGDYLEIPIVVEDKDSDIESFKIEGLNKDFTLLPATKLPNYQNSIIKGKAITPGKVSILANSSDKCGKNVSFKFDVFILKPGEQLPKNDGQIEENKNSEKPAEVKN